MVTSNKQPDKKVVKMDEENNAAVVPQRTLLGEVNEHITCPLCRGYYIDATTIVECLHSFCRSCIIKHLQVKSYCPVCEMMINSAKPNIKLDKALQDIVYKLVPGLFQKEMERRQQFYSSRPGPAASATPEQRGEDTERIIFSPEDVISFSLEYSDLTDTDSISSKSSDSNEPQQLTGTTRRYLQCPAVVNINHLKKFLSMKFDIDSTQFAIDILYKRVPLPDYYTLMDIAYIYNWKRNEPMRFFYQIIDYVAIRNRLFDSNRKGSHFPERKCSPTGTEETNMSSPTPNINDQGSEVSSGTDSPMPDENNVKKMGDIDKKNMVLENSTVNDSLSAERNNCISPTKKNDDEVEKSQFLNSFELTAKNNSLTSKSPSKTNENTSPPKDSLPKTTQVKTEDTLKRKQETTKNLPEMKKIKIVCEKAKVLVGSNIPLATGTSGSNNEKNISSMSKSNFNNQQSHATNTIAAKDIKQTSMPIKQQSDNLGLKRPVVGAQNTSPKRKPIDLAASAQSTPKLVSPIKLQIPKAELQSQTHKQGETLRPVVKKIPDLKSSLPQSSIQNKGPGKLRMDLLSNNCDPTSDRSKLLSQVKNSLPVPNLPQSSGDPLKSLFDSCKINIPSSLSITLTDQKLDPRSPEQSNIDAKKNIINKNLANASGGQHKVSNPPVHNYIEILKLPDTDPKKQLKTDNHGDKTVVSNKPENSSPIKPTKSPESSAKGPVPNLKPIADTKLGKHSSNFSGPITFQQTFEQQLLQSDKKPKLPKTKAQVPKLVPATPKSFNANKINNQNNIKLPGAATEPKASVALDLSTPHNIQSQLGPQQTKAFETMQSIANLAKKQGIPTKSMPQTIMQGNNFSTLSNRTIPSNVAPLRVPSTSNLNQMKIEKINQNILQANSKQETNQKSSQVKQPINSMITSPNYQNTSHSSTSTTQPSPRLQTRSPSSSPKLIIAEDKQSSSTSEHNQSNQITSTQTTNIGSTKSVSPKPAPGPSKSMLKPLRPLMPIGKITSIRQPITPNINTSPSMPSPTEYLSQPQLITHAQHAILRHQMEVQNAWFKAQRQFDLLKNMSNMAHQTQNDYNSKEKQ